MKSNDNLANSTANSDINGSNKNLNRRTTMASLLDLFTSKRNRSLFLKKRSKEHQNMPPDGENNIDSHSPPSYTQSPYNAISNPLSPEFGSSRIAYKEFASSFVCLKEPLRVISNGELDRSGSRSDLKDDFKYRQKHNVEQYVKSRNTTDTIACTTASRGCAFSKRLLLFVENSSGERSIIFDSDKHRSLLVNSNSSGGTHSAENQLATTQQSQQKHQTRLKSNSNLLSTSTSTISTTASKTPTPSIMNTTSRVFTSPSGVSSTSNSSSPSSSSIKLTNEMLIRMVFGSSPMVFTNKTAIKVHSLK
jgi:hypothetical protein